jgi:hypothetical protein
MLAHRMAELQELADWGYGRRGNVAELVSKPRNPSIGIAEGRVHEDGAFRRKENLQSGDIFEVKAQNMQPVG